MQSHVSSVKLNTVQTEESLSIAWLMDEPKNLSRHITLYWPCQLLLLSLSLIVEKIIEIQILLKCIITVFIVVVLFLAAPPAAGCRAHLVGAGRNAVLQCARTPSKSFWGSLFPCVHHRWISAPLAPPLSSRCSHTHDFYRFYRFYRFRVSTSVTKLSTHPHFAADSATTITYWTME